MPQRRRDPRGARLCGLAPLAAGVGAVVFGWFCVRLSGVYLAMLTLAFAQITWSIVFQWYEVTGGDNGILGIWPSPWAAVAGVAKAWEVPRDLLLREREIMRAALAPCVPPSGCASTRRRTPACHGSWAPGTTPRSR